MSISSVSYSGGFAALEPSISTMASSLPLGTQITFTPTDSQLIQFLLHDSSPDFIITDCDLFGHEEPWEIWDKFLGFRNQFNPDELYFFMPALKKLSPNGGSRINRTIGAGSWTQKEPFKIVCADEDEGRAIGVKRKLKYLNQRSDQNAQWCLDEYTSTVEGHRSCAIFRLRRNERQHKSLSGICVEDFNQTLLLGMRIFFRPTESQLIRYFIGLNIAPDFIVYDCDLFDQEEPWEIWERYSAAFNKPDLLYFYASSMKRLSSKGRGCNFDRRVGSGTWNQKEAAKFVYEDVGEADQERKPKRIGKKRKLRYVNEGSVHHGEWYLEEFTSLVDEGAVLLLRRNERYKAPCLSISSDIPKEKKRKRQQIDQLEDKKPKRKKVVRQLDFSDSLNRQGESGTTPTVHIQQQKPDNVDDVLEFFKDVDTGTWEFPSFDDFVMACPPALEDCDLEALASLEFPSLDEFFTACPPPLEDCDQEASTSLELPSLVDLTSPSPSAGDQQAIAAVDIDDNFNLTGSCNDDDLAKWDFPIEENCSLTSLKLPSLDDLTSPSSAGDQQATAAVDIDDNFNLTGSCNDDDLAALDFPIEYCSLTSLLQGNCDVDFKKWSMETCFVDFDEQA
ncbi:hypothetical protein ACLB2K_074059 [Fragaria x ananassa]